jgi:lipid A 3-O-deacylase
MSTSRFEQLRPLLFIALLLITEQSAADETSTSWSSSIKPDLMFLQAGDGDRTRTLTLGLSWNLPWSERWANGMLSAYLDASVGRWWMNDTSSAHGPWVTQIGLTPVLRYRWGASRPSWFAELGIGANVLTPIIDNDDRRFGTAFNFGDHLALGRAFGEDGRQEIALRVQHYSNGGIKQPNPGINFVQLRYSRRVK